MSQPHYNWAIIGAGPAGILAVGKLLDQGVDPTTILWLDPKFQVGDLGAYWLNVPSNTKVGLFENFLSACQSFNYAFPKEHELNHLDPLGTCLLKYLIEPLTQITQHLLNKVDHKKALVTGLNLIDNQWQLSTKNETLSANKVILATGAEPKTLDYKQLKTIELTTALNPDLLTQHIQSDDNVAVFGASHSAVLVLKNLLELGCQVTHFYKHEVRYAIFREHDTIYDNTGLKGSAATWAKQHLHGQKVPKLTRHYLASGDHIEEQLTPCNKVVYAIGFNQRTPKMTSINCNDYDRHTGIIARKLFGLGIAFPESIICPLGHTEASVGLAKFVKYIDKVMPLWMNYADLG